jgi:phosphomannomutase
MNSAIFKAYDVRGLYPADINKESVSRITEACSRLFAEGAVVIGHDGRHGSVELADTAKNILERSGKFTLQG